MFWLAIGITLFLLACLVGAMRKNTDDTKRSGCGALFCIFSCKCRGGGYICNNNQL